MTEKAFVKGRYCWQAFNKARCSNEDKNMHALRKTGDSLCSIYRIYVTAENLLRIFPKGSKLKKNTFCWPMTSLVWTAAPSRRWQSVHSLSSSPVGPSFSVLFSQVYSSLQMSVLVRHMPIYYWYCVTASGPTHCLTLLFAAAKSHSRDLLPCLLEDERKPHAGHWEFFCSWFMENTHLRSQWFVSLGSFIRNMPLFILQYLNYCCTQWVCIVLVILLLYYCTDVQHDNETSGQMIMKCH